MTPRQAALQGPEIGSPTPWNGDQLFSSASVEWSTPDWLFEHLDANFGFELDASATAHNTLCPDFIGPEEDSLVTAWLRPGMERKTVWLNPPWGRGIAKWVHRAWEQCEKHGLTVVCVLPATTDVGWWHEVAMKHASEIHLVRGRLRFVRSDGHSGPCTKGSAVVVFDPHASGPPDFWALEKE